MDQMINCLECGGALIPEIVLLEGERNGNTYTVQVPGYKCHSCGFATVDNEQSSEFTRALSDAYRADKGLLTGVEIRERRKKLGMSQQEFASYLGTGVASVKRWELGQIQDKAMDELIRLKTDPEAARLNLRSLEFQVPEEHVLSVAADLDLRFSLEQTFSPTPKMRMGAMSMEGLEDGELLAA